MFNRILSVALIGTLCVAVPASAQTVISGKYLVTLHKYCIPTMTVNSGSYSGGGNYVTVVTLGGSNVENNMVLATFSPTKQNVSATGFSDDGNVMLVHYTGSVNGNSGSPFQETAVSGKSPYSNTDTTITFGGQTFNAFYGQVDKNSIAHYLTFQGDFTDEGGDSCSEQGEASRQ
jgi:hypothetical protein